MYKQRFIEDNIFKVAKDISNKLNLDVTVKNIDNIIGELVNKETYMKDSLSLKEAYMQGITDFMNSEFYNNTQKLENPSKFDIEDEDEDSFLNDL